ncbi:MAG: hypothetical protein U0R19_38425 [Bryobacteraceae bacterium]
MPKLEGNTKLISTTPFDGNRDLITWLNTVQDLRRFQSNPVVDVMLVQFLLIQVFRRSNLPVVHKPGRPLTIDGSYGEITESFVNQFQTNSTLQSRIHPPKLRIPGQGDGKVSKAPSSFAAHQFTIYRLQWALADLAPDVFFVLIAAAKAGKLASDFLKSGMAPAGIPVLGSPRVLLTL